MSTEKFERLIDLIINENQEQAEALFHEIVVEKSREIYESLIEEESLDEDQVTDLVDEISAEEEGMDEMMEEDDEFTDDEEIDGDYDVEGDDGSEEMEVDFSADEEDFDDMGGEEELEDRVVDLEDKLDELMAEFEAMMGDDGSDDEMEMDDSEEESDDEVMESVEMKKVATPSGGDDGAQKVSPVAKNSGATGMASKPVSFSSGSAENGRPAPSTKPVTSIKFKNAPAGDGSKGESAPAPKKEVVKSKSPVPESKRSSKKMVK